MADDAAAPDGELSEGTPEAEDAADDATPPTTRPTERRRLQTSDGKDEQADDSRRPARPRCRMSGSPRFSGW